MFIQTEETPNPATLKFLPGRQVMESGTAEFKAEDETARSPLAQALFQVDGVTGVFLGYDFISVSKRDGKEAKRGDGGGPASTRCVPGRGRRRK